MMKALLLVAALTALTVGAAPETQEGPALELQAVRFYRAGGAQTLFDGFFRVPFAQLDEADAVDLREAAGIFFND